VGTLNYLVFAWAKLSRSPKFFWQLRIVIVHLLLLLIFAYIFCFFKFFTGFFDSQCCHLSVEILRVLGFATFSFSNIFWELQTVLVKCYSFLITYLVFQILDFFVVSPSVGGNLKLAWFCIG